MSMVEVGMRERQKQQRHRHGSNEGLWEELLGESATMMENGVVRIEEETQEDDDTRGGRDSVLDADIREGNWA